MHVCLFLLTLISSLCLVTEGLCASVCVKVNERASSCCWCSCTCSCLIMAVMTDVKPYMDPSCPSPLSTSIKHTHTHAHSGPSLSTVCSFCIWLLIWRCQEGSSKFATHFLFWNCCFRSVLWLGLCLFYTYFSWGPLLFSQGIYVYIFHLIYIFFLFQFHFSLPK